MLDTLTPTLPNTRSHLLGEPTGDLAFKIRGGEHHGRIVRLRALKCTIGSAADCTLRLCAPGVRELHCLILRGEAGAVVRKWSPDTHLNGRSFTDALLTAGDRLQIGPVELELIEADSPKTESPSLREAPFPPLNLSKGIASRANIPAVPPETLVAEITQKVRGDLERRKFRRFRVVVCKKLSAAKQRLIRLKKELRRTKNLLQAGQAESERLRNALTLAEQTQLAQRHSESLAQATSASLSELQTQYESASQMVASLRTECERLAEQLQATERSSLQERDAWSQERTALAALLTSQKHEFADQQLAAESLRIALEENRLELLKAAEQHQQKDHELSALHKRCEEIVETSEYYQQEEAATRREIETLRHSIEALEFSIVEHEEKASECAELRTSLANAEQAVVTAQALVEQRSQECNALRAESNRLANELQAALMASAQAGRRVEELSAAMEIAGESAVSELSLSLSCAKEQLLQSASLAAERSQACEALQAELASCNTQLQTASAESNHWKAKCEQLNQTLLQLQPQAELDVSTLAEQRIRIAQLEQLYADQERSSCALAEEFAQSRAERKQLNNLFEQARGEVERFRIQNEELHQAAELSRVESEQNHAETEQLRDQFIAAKQINAALDRKVIELGEQLQTLRLAAETLAASQTTEDASAQWNAERAQWQEKIQASEQDRETQANRFNDLHSQLLETRSELNQRDQMLTQIRDEVRQQMRVWEEERAQLQAELEQAVRRLVLEQALEVDSQTSLTPAESSEERAEDPRSLDARYPELMSWQQEWKEKIPSPNEEGSFPRVEEANELPETPPEPVVAGDSDAVLNAVLARLGAAGILKEGDHAHEAVNRFASQPASEYSAAYEPESQADFSTPSPVETTETYLAQTVTDEEEAAETHESAPPVPVVNSIPPEPATAASGDDDSIEDYMAKLMRRVRGDSVATAFTESRKPAAVVVEEPKPTLVPEEVNVPVAPQAEAAYAPRSQPPEMTIDLSALRELAMSSAHQAIDLSWVRTQRQRALGTSFAAICAFAAGNVLLYYGQHHDMNWAAFAAVAAFGLGAHWVIQRLKMLRPAKHQPTKATGPQFPPRERRRVERTTIVEPNADSGT